MNDLTPTTTAATATPPTVRTKLGCIFCTISIISLKNPNEPKTPTTTTNKIPTAAPDNPSDTGHNFLNITTSKMACIILTYLYLYYQIKILICQRFYFSWLFRARYFVIAQNSLIIPGEVRSSNSPKRISASLSSSSILINLGLRKCKKPKILFSLKKYFRPFFKKVNITLLKIFCEKTLFNEV